MRAYQPRPDLLNDRVILVTGATGGLGRAAALSFAAHGATVILHGRNRRKLETLNDEILAAGHPAPALALIDLEKAQAPAYFDLRDQLASQYGRLDGLLHNAGLLGGLMPIEHHPVDLWHRVMHVNLTVPFVLTQVLYTQLQASPDASVVFTGSGVGRRGRAFWGAYAASKAGVENLVQTLADEADGQGTLRVNCLNPGRTRTPMRNKAYPAEDPATLPDPDSLMGPYLFLIGPDSRGINGASLDCQ
ncbi:MAG: YciK family oxidoreductase [Chromatiales bacterium]|nr:YciK family oxidoreductase [Chromatiales bacterium]